MYIPICTLVFMLHAAILLKPRTRVDSGYRYSMVIQILNSHKDTHTWHGFSYIIILFTLNMKILSGSYYLVSHSLTGVVTKRFHCALFKILIKLRLAPSLSKPLQIVLTLQTASYICTQLSRAVWWVHSNDTNCNEFIRFILQPFMFLRW